MVITSVNRFSHVLFDMSQRFGISVPNFLTNLQKELHFAEIGTSPSQLFPRPGDGKVPLDNAMGCGPKLVPPPLGFVRQLACGGRDTLAARFNDPASVNVEFFPAPTGELDEENPQWAWVPPDAGCVSVAVAYQPSNRASRAEARFTNTVINCDKAGTYSFSYWWHYFFGGPP